MNETEHLAALCRTFRARYETWLGCREAGVETLFVRMHLREMRKVIEKIESIEAARDTPSVEVHGITPQIVEVQQALQELDRTVARLAERRSLIDCLTDLPEFLLLEIDQALDVSVDPEKLDDFGPG